MNTKIIPEIKSLKITAGEINLCDFSISEDIAKRLPVSKEIFTDNKKSMGDKKIIFKTENMAKEAYTISVKNDEIIIGAGTNRGLMYALFTLSELALLNDDVISCCEISDEPTLNFRALSDDISRGQISTFQNFLDIIKRLARYKYNTYMPYIEDVFAFANIPAWGRYSEPIKKDEWLAIIDYAKKYQMDVRPIINLLGHFDKLSNIKELQPLALKHKNGEITHVMNPKNPQTREIICTMLDEIVDTFGEGLIHCGGDEPVDLTKVFGKDEGAELFISHYTFIANELKKRNCTLMMYADFFAPPWGDYAVPIERAKQLPNEVEFVFWDYAVRSDYPFVPALHNQGLKMYISPGTWTWKRFSCDMHLCYDNTKGLLKADNGKSLGMIMSCWADGGDTLREMAWAGNVIGANFCWAPNSEYSYDDVYETFHKSFYGINPEQAVKLDVIYHHDSIIPREYEHEFKHVMFANPFEPLQFKAVGKIKKMQTAMKKAEMDIKNIIPLRNVDSFNALYLSLARINFTARKIAELPHKKPLTIEEGTPFCAVALSLAAELLTVKELHRKLWFASNRNSEWDICACRYDDQYDQLNMFARNVKLRKYFNMHE